MDGVLGSWMHCHSADKMTREACIRWSEHYAAVVEDRRHSITGRLRPLGRCIYTKQKTRSRCVEQPRHSAHEIAREITKRRLDKRECARSSVTHTRAAVHDVTVITIHVYAIAELAVVSTGLVLPLRIDANSLSCQS